MARATDSGGIVVDAGNFSLGMAPDVIGGNNTVTNLVDGFVERLGSVRKRGGKKTIDIFDTGVSLGYTSQPIGTSSKDGLHLYIDPDNPDSDATGYLYDDGSTITTGEAITGIPATAGGWSICRYGDDWVCAARDDGVASVVGVFDGTSWSNINTTTPIAGVSSAQVVEQHDGRLIVKATDSPSRIRISHEPTTGGYDDFDAKAYIDVFPGVGGDITGIHSWNDYIVIVKESAVALIRGTFTDNFRGASFSVELLSDIIGGTDYASSEVSRIGVVIANSAGLYIFNGGELQNITDGVIQTLWQEVFSDSSLVGGLGFYLPPKFRVSCTERRIIVRGEKDEVPSIVIYDINKKIFYRQEESSDAGFTPSGLIDGSERSIILYKPDGWVASEPFNIYYIDWSTDYTNEYDSDEYDSSMPRLVLETTSLNASSRPFKTGRPNNIFVDGKSDTDLQIELIHGRDTNDETEILEYGFKTQDFEDVQRIPVDGVTAKPSYRIRLTQEESANDIRIYGIGLELSEDRTIEPR